MKRRTVTDSFGSVEIDENRAWGAMTQRCSENFAIGTETVPMPVIRALLEIKAAAAVANADGGVLDREKATAIVTACDSLLSADCSEHFPLKVWQTGSGTQTNMNVNEVICGISEYPLHPNDDVNRSQSSNDVFPAALHMASYREITEHLLPETDALIHSFRVLEDRHSGILKVGRTHLQDATPIALSQEISGWRAALEQNARMIRQIKEELLKLAIGGTAVGTGLNTFPGYEEGFIRTLRKRTGIPFTTDENKFKALSVKSELSAVHGLLRTLAADLMKIANDIRWLASGPRCGLGELSLPANEPGSSIMPGKVNPTQCEALTMISARVLGNDTTVGLCAAMGNFELNVFMPLIGYCMDQSIRLLSDGMRSFRTLCVDGISVHEERMAENLERTLMSVTALNPLIGYARGAELAKRAFSEGRSLREVALESGYVTAEEFDAACDPRKMV